MNDHEFLKIVYDKRFWGFIVIILVLVAGVLLTDFGVVVQQEVTKEADFKGEPLKFTVVRVEPLPDQKDVSTSPTIEISFEKPIKEGDIKVTSKPAASFTKTLSSGGHYLTLKPKQSLKTATKYTLDVAAGKIKVYQWSFTTSNKSGDLQAIEKIKAKLPYKGNHFRISYASSTDKFFVTIDAKPVASYEKAALSWFASQGLANAEKAINIVIYPVGKASD